MTAFLHYGDFFPDTVLRAVQRRRPLRIAWLLVVPPQQLDSIPRITAFDSLDGLREQWSSRHMMSRILTEHD